MPGGDFFSRGAVKTHVGLPLHSVPQNQRPWAKGHARPLPGRLTVTPASDQRVSVILDIGQPTQTLNGSSI